VRLLNGKFYVGTEFRARSEPMNSRIVGSSDAIPGIISRSLQIFFLTLTLRYPRQSERLEKLA
jgi:hypothetical protein